LSPAPRIAVLIPCYNEAVAIAGVISEFAAQLPGAGIFVYDNNSTDGTAQVAAGAGAVVRSEVLQGKGNVVRRMFADIDADVYVLVDGDGTYDAASAPRLVHHLVEQSLDMVNGSRQPVSSGTFRPGHRFGNRMLTALVASIFGNRLTDLLSGYRVLSRRFVKSFPALASGFEIETELTVHALELRLPIDEMPTPYRDRPRGSISKLRTVSDGVRIFRMITRLVKEERPFQFFAVMAAFFVISSLAFGSRVIVDYLETGLVLRLPMAVLATGLMIIGFLCIVCGLVLDTVTRGRREIKRLHYLALPGQPPLAVPKSTLTTQTGIRRAE
jgi:glycosyltransferase involved in cell wall biosynthesis